MPAYTSITVIYNPHSTGPSKKLARELRTDLRKAGLKQTVTLLPTKYAGHAEALAYELAMSSKRPLIISSSGDGGYYEVINGLMKARLEGARPTAGLLPAGNANDHYHNLHQADIVPAIRRGHGEPVDLLRLVTTSGGKPLTRYAHSYIGLGLTAKAGARLNQAKLNPLYEIWIVLKVLFFLKPIRLVVNKRALVYDSLIFSNVKSMSKVLSLSEAAAPDDGTFQITPFYRRNKIKLITTLLKASTIGLKGTKRARTFTFRTTTPTLLQLDGEVITVDAAIRSSIRLERAVLRCIV